MLGIFMKDSAGLSPAVW